MHAQRTDSKHETDTKTQGAQKNKNMAASPTHRYAGNVSSRTSKKANIVATQFQTQSHTTKTSRNTIKQNPTH